MAQIAPHLVTTVSKRNRACRVVADALHNDGWIADISGSLSIAALTQYISV
jgi:threonine dehydratase